MRRYPSYLAFFAREIKLSFARVDIDLLRIDSPPRRADILAIKGVGTIS